MTVPNDCLSGSAWAVRGRWEFERRYRSLVYKEPLGKDRVGWKLRKSVKLKQLAWIQRSQAP